VPTLGNLSAFYAMFPGNHKFNVFPLWLSEEHHARLSTVFAPHIGHPHSEDLDSEYLNALETRTRTPFFQDVYVDGVRVMLIIGPTGSGKSVYGNALVALEQKYGGFTYIFDIGGSYESVVELYGGNGSPRLVMSMHLLHRLPGQRTDPTGSPTKHSGTEQRAEKPWYGILKPPRHHADAGEDEAAETDNRTRINREGFKRSHQRLCPGEVHRSLGMGDTAAYARKGESNQRRPHDVSGMAEFLFGEELCPPFNGGSGRPTRGNFRPERAADSEHLCTSADLVLSARRNAKSGSRKRPMTFWVSVIPFWNDAAQNGAANYLYFVVVDDLRSSYAAFV
jgi:type IV secretory system conjugative DNA transfer VirD4/TraG family protein